MNSASNKRTYRPAEAKFVNYSDQEEATKVESMIYLESSIFKRYVLLPLLSLCTAFMILLFIHWYPKIKKFLLYSESTKDRATQMFVTGAPGNMEVVDIIKRNDEFINELRMEQQIQYQENPLITLDYRFIRFEYNKTKDSFEPIKFNVNRPFKEFLQEYSNGLPSESDLIMGRIMHGRAVIEVPIKSIPALLVQEILNPFYVFQLFSIVLWYYEEYSSYASCILIISVFSASIELYETVTNLKRIKNMAYYTCPMKSFRNKYGVKIEEVIDSSDLIPGDLVEIPENCIIPCDICLISGQCIVNEAMLTGESVPVIKNDIPETEDIYDPNKDQKYTLYGGTKVIQKREMNGQKVLGVVIRTAFVTSKGNLVRDILYPKPSKFQFYRDSLYFVGTMAVLAFVGFFATMPKLKDFGYTPGDMAVLALDMVTITVPPALPAAMSVGIVLSIKRLQWSKIFCISPPRINVAGRVNMMVFDKTGTLTEDGMQVLGYRNIRSDFEQATFNDFKSDITEIIPENFSWWKDENEFGQLKNQKHVLFSEALASCHAITYVGDELIGDPLEVRMFQATNWILKESKKDLEEGEQFKGLVQIAYSEEKNAQNKKYKLTLHKRFDFNSQVMRMSVVVQNELDGSIKAFIKGSPEKIKELSAPSSLPEDYDQILQEYTEKGLRVIALGYMPLQVDEGAIHSLEREKLEKDFEFLGFLIMENKLKEATPHIIQQLSEAKVRCVMATGDNILTAISVASDCKIISKDTEVFIGDLELVDGYNKIVWKNHKNEDIKLSSVTLAPKIKKTGTEGMQGPTERDLKKSSVAPVLRLDDYTLALTGKAFNYLVNDQTKHSILQKVLLRSSIYARMSPDDKAILVQNLQDCCKTEVGMCGDGANDCGALKQADIGISLSEAEASIAAPFTSQVQDISCVVTLLREGRCALTTSFQMFKFMELYSMIQFTSVCLLYYIGSNLSDFQFLYADLFQIIPLSMFMGWTRPYSKLTEHRPEASLISVPVITSMVGVIALQFCSQLIPYLYIRSDSQDYWYTPLIIDPEEDNYICYENSVVFLIQTYEYMIVCLAFSVSKPYRKPFYTNIPFTVTVFLLFFVSIFITFGDYEWTNELFDIQTDPVPIPMEVRWVLFAVAAADAVLTYCYEKALIWQLGVCWTRRKERKLAQELKKIGEREEAGEVQHSQMGLVDNGSFRLEVNENQSSL